VVSSGREMARGGMEDCAGLSWRGLGRWIKCTATVPVSLDTRQSQQAELVLGDASWTRSVLWCLLAALYVRPASVVALACHLFERKEAGWDGVITVFRNPDDELSTVVFS
jgi:hypothetical protein